MIKIQFEFQTIEEAIVALGTLSDLKDQQQKQPAKPEPTVASKAADAAAKQVNSKEPSKVIQTLLAEHGLKAADVPASGKNGALTKADVEAHIRALNARKASEQTIDPPVVEDNPSDVAITKAEVEETLRKVYSKVGTQDTINLLSEFGVKRVSLLPENQYAAFMKKCKTILDPA